MVRDALDRYRNNDVPGALTKLDALPAKERDAPYFILRAGLLLSVGRVNEARLSINQALDLQPDNGTAFALLSIIALSQNDAETALELARQSAELEPRSPVPHTALAYAYQALFNIETALQQAQQAVDLGPNDALAWARLAELELSTGYLDRALSSARKAAAFDPGIERTQTVLGFAYLTQIEVDESLVAFNKAITLDSSAPLPRLGLGLALIRQGNLDAGTHQIEIAASLDPNNALIRSYLGKAYYEQKRIQLASTELEFAKQLDPNDPTAYFYDAVLKQTTNRPVEALHDMQQAIDLNDNRAVYRSRLLLDQDLAARTANIARIYDDIGFQQRALLEGWQSINRDPKNYSGHRFLADTYRALPRHEVARVSELLQAQLLQPINITPIQPQQGETDLLILEGAGPTNASFNEFNPLFARNRLALQAGGGGGSDSTWGR